MEILPRVFDQRIRARLLDKFPHKKPCLFLIITQTEEKSKEIYYKNYAPSRRHRPTAEKFNYELNITFSLSNILASNTDSATVQTTLETIVIATLSGLVANEKME